jgi:hydrogenase maturation protease
VNQANQEGKMGTVGTPADGLLHPILICGFGNPFRRDDGAGRAVINRLRIRLGRPLLGPLDDGAEDLGHPVDTLVLHQLLPELAELIAGYQLVIFVDAHVGSLAEPLHEECIDAVPGASAWVSHQTHPGTLLLLAHQMSGHSPRGVMLSLRGHDFDFGEGLSPQTEALLPRAVARIEKLVEEARVEGPLHAVQASV